MNNQFKIWPILRDVIIVTVLSCLGGFIVGYASTSGHNTPLYIYSLAISNSLFLTIGFTISGCLATENRWRHLAFVAAIIWAESIFSVVFFGVTIIQWAALAIAIAIFALIGGGISLLFKRNSMVETATNCGDEKFYEEVARELQEKPMVPGLWTKAFAEMGGDDAKARALYIKFRVAQLVEAGRHELEKDQNATKQQEKPKRIQNTKELLLAAFVFVVAIILVVVYGEMTSNKNVKPNASAVAPTEQPTPVQTPAASKFDRQKELAEKGDANAQSDLGSYYSLGLGVTKDYAEALKWYRMAADQGNAGAEDMLGTYYANGFGVEKNEAEAVKWYRKAAEQGSVNAANKLGDCYAYGWGVQTNFVEAFKWYSLAAQYYGEKARQNRNK